MAIKGAEVNLLERIEKGEITRELKQVAVKEGVTPEQLADLIRRGEAVIPHNLNRELKQPVGIGKGLATKVNANIGSSQEFSSLQDELLKLEKALEAKTDTVMDLSTGGNVKLIRRGILAKSTVPVGTVPIYEVALRALDEKGSIVEMEAEDMFTVVEEQAQEGVDFMTIHAGVNLKTLEALKKQDRLTGVVSRGGTFTLAFMLHHERENPFYENFERLLTILKKHDVTLSLGDGFRPGSIADATDIPQIGELIVLSELVKEARKAKVQVMVEGPGHIPLNQIEENIKLQKSLCQGAPFYVLGPLVTDIAPGYDHIVSAIGGALAAYYGADFLCYVTPREHLGLPTPDDVREGVIVARIAAHAADLAKGLKQAHQWDHQMSKARRELNWQKQIELSLDPTKASEFWRERRVKDEAGCSMCGDFCALKIVNELLKLPTPKEC
jgi:phosphomethylpyrimidine synthase